MVVEKLSNLLWVHPMFDEHRLADAAGSDKNANPSKYPPLPGSFTVVGQQTPLSVMQLWGALLQRYDAGNMCTPDVWFDVDAHELYKSASAAPEHRRQFLRALRPGDCMFHAAKRAEIFRHVVMYVGFGCIVDFIPIGNFRPCIPLRAVLGVVGQVRLSFLGHYDTPVGGWFPGNPSDDLLTATERMLRVRRALSSMGYYRYTIHKFNCQHAINLWCDCQQLPASEGVISCAALALVGSTLPVVGVVAAM